MLSNIHAKNTQPLPMAHLAEMLSHQEWARHTVLVFLFKGQMPFSPFLFYLKNNNKKDVHSTSIYPFWQERLIQRQKHEFLTQFLSISFYFPDLTSHSSGTAESINPVTYDSLTFSCLSGLSIIIPCLSLSSLSVPLYLSLDPQCEGRPDEGSLNRSCWQSAHSFPHHHAYSLEGCLSFSSGGSLC